jgi:hypothetical protein
VLVPVSPLARTRRRAAYESTLGVRAYVGHRMVGEELPDMLLFLRPQEAVDIPLEASYRAAFAKVPRRWRNILETLPR